MADAPRTGPIALLSVGLCALSGCLAKGAPSPTGGGRGQDGGDVPTVAFDGGVCNTTGCVPLDCGPGSRAVPLPGECCPTVCESTDCSIVACAPVVCPTGTHEVTLTDRCCPACAANPKPKPGDTCESGQAGYLTYYDDTVSSLGAALCNVDSDCRIVKLANACRSDCGTAVAARLATTLQSQLSAYATAHCSACPPSTDTCTTIEQIAYCTGGVCSAH